MDKVRGAETHEVGVCGCVERIFCVSAWKTRFFELQRAPQRNPSRDFGFLIFIFKPTPRRVPKI